MRLNHAATALLVLAIGVGGLACRKPAPLPPERPKVDLEAEAAARVKAEAEAKAAAEAKRKAEEEARRKTEQENAEAARKAEAAKVAAYKQAAEKALQDAHFDYDKSVIKEEDKNPLQALADFLKANPQAKIQIEGHCDERGTVEYNLALGDRRASVVRSYLKALGVPEGRMNTISYGKERPLCVEKNEGCWHQNRRAHFVLKG